jgi:nucleotide-binding universal stress UspA family protein
VHQSSEVRVSFERIMVAVDEDPIAVHAADVAIDLAAAVGAKLALIHVIDPASAAIPEAGISANELVARAKQDALRWLSAVRQRVPGGVAPLEFVKVGSPAGEIVQAAVEWPADLIVIGSHGRRGVTRALLGSVAEAVMRHASCPVLVVRAPSSSEASS